MKDYYQLTTTYIVEKNLAGSQEIIIKRYINHKG